MDAINYINVWVSSLCSIVICNEVCHMFLDNWSTYHNWHNTIVSWWYFECQFNCTYCCLLFTFFVYVTNFPSFLNVTVFFLCPLHMIMRIFCMLMPKISSVSSNWSQIIKLCVNLNSAILSCNAIVPIVDIGEPSAVFSLAVLGCMGVL